MTRTEPRSMGETRAGTDAQCKLCNCRWRAPSTQKLKCPRCENTRKEWMVCFEVQ